MDDSRRYAGTVRLAVLSIATLLLPGAPRGVRRRRGERQRRCRPARGPAVGARLRCRSAAGRGGRTAERDIRERDRLGLDGLQSVHGRLHDRRQLARDRRDRDDADGVPAACRRHRAGVPRCARAGGGVARGRRRVRARRRGRGRAAALRARDPRRELAGDRSPERRRVREPDRRDGAHRDVRRRRECQRVERLQHLHGRITRPTRARSRSRTSPGRRRPAPSRLGSWSRRRRTSPCFRAS